MALKQIDLAYQTMLSELEQRCLDAEFDEAFPETGLFKKTTVKGLGYWYFQERIEGRYKKRYVGPDSDPEIAKRVAAWKSVKDDYTARRRLVSTLVNDAGLPRPDDMAGDLLEVLWKAGLFRMRAVLVGSVAFGCYPGLLGIRLPASVLRTGDLDVAQFHSISVSIDDSLPQILDVLRKVDDSFAEVPHLTDPRCATRFVSAGRFAVEFLTPNTSKDEYLGRPAEMPALGARQPSPYVFWTS
ncbi:MAG: GSU2403 family nucleotidyltransferase fold protein [Magnetospirillum sp.]|nr:GSU2403 family nucleotidyltransferase fold protein [Magnetospirillum sp.]